jgi:outer membrane protein TolC
MAPSGNMGSGNSGMTDVLRVRIEIRGLETTLEFSKDSRKTLTAEFNQLLNRGIDDAVVVAEDLPDSGVSTDQLARLDSLMQNNPMLEMLDAEGGAYEAQVKMARLMGRPMLGAGVSYMAFGPRAESGMSMGGEDMVMPMVSVSIPIYRKKNNARVREAELKEQSIQQRRENTVNQLATQWAEALRELDDATRRTALYREQTALANQTLNLLMTGYSTNGQDFEEVLRVQQQLLDYQLNLVTAVVDQHMVVAMLEMLAGNNILIE